MPKLYHGLPLALSALVPLLAGCFDPSYDGTEGPVFPEQPPPDKPYACASSVSMSCVAPQVRAWLPGWIVTFMAARGDKAAFVAYPALPSGGADRAAVQHLGQLSLANKTLDWVLPLGKTQDDFYLLYDIVIAPNGDVIVGASGYGELLLGDKIGQFDGFVASFDSFGKKRFAQRFNIFDVEPPINERPQLINLKIIANDSVFVQTAFQYTKANQPTIVPIHLFAFSPDGKQTLRQEVPIVQGSYSGTMWPVPDGTMWIKPFPGPYYRYSKTGQILDTFELQPSAEMRGFTPMSSKTMLINLTTKGMTNEMYRFELGTPLVPLFSEETFPQFHAAAIVPSLDFQRTYLVSLNYNALAHRIQSIDVNGQRSAATTVQNVHSRFTILDNGDAVFARQTDFGTEFIVQPL